MKYRVFFLFSWALLVDLFSPSVQAQPPSPLDSLRLVADTTQQPSGKISAWISLFYLQRDQDSASFFPYIHQAIKLSEQIGHDSLFIKSRLVLAQFYWTQEKTDSTLQILSHLEHHPSLTHYPELEASLYQYRGLVQQADGDYQAAIENLLNSLTLFEEIRDTAGMRENSVNIGSVFWRMNDLDQALAYYKKGADLNKGNQNNFSQAAIYGNMGLIYRANGVYDTAMQYYQKSLEVFEEIGAHTNSVINLQNMGSLFFRQEKYDKALPYYEQALRISQENGYERGELFALHSIALVDVKKRRYDKGITGLEEALAMAKEMKNKEEIKSLYEALAETHKEAGQYKKAYENRLLFESWQDSILSENHLNQIKELELQYETAKKDDQITMLTQENEIQTLRADRQETWNKALIGGLILMVVIATLSYYLFRQRLRNQQLLASKNMEIKETRFQRELTQSEMKALRAQMNPHFIFNCLNSINRLVLDGKEEEASRYLAKFSKLLRGILENSEEPVVSLQDEMTMLHSYVELEALRLKETIQYQVYIDPQIDPEETHIPSMVLQPIIENAIWHGLSHKTEKGELRVSIEQEGEDLRCKIEDNGVGRERARDLTEIPPAKTRSMGLEIIQERLKLFKQDISTLPLFAITDIKDEGNQTKGTRVELALPTL